MHPNKLAFEAIESGQVHELVGYEKMKREAPHGKNSRIDILLSNNGRQLCYTDVEIIILSGTFCHNSSCPRFVIVCGR
ncbi:MAG: hypothetical protein GY927_13510 [bacterium]|nr:hypothetical protein [bacterium]